MCATTMSSTSLHTALTSQFSSSFWPFSSTTPTFRCTSSALPRFWQEAGGEKEPVSGFFCSPNHGRGLKFQKTCASHSNHYWWGHSQSHAGFTGHLHKLGPVEVLQWVWEINVVLGSVDVYFINIFREGVDVCSISLSGHLCDDYPQRDFLPTVKIYTFSNTLIMTRPQLLM